MTRSKYLESCVCDIVPVIVPRTNSRYHTHRAVNKSERLSYLDSDAHPAKVEDRVAEHVRKFPTTWRDAERRARASRPQLRRVTVAAQTGLVLVRNRESRPPALSRHGPDRRTLLVRVCPPSPPRPPSSRQGSPPTSAEGCASPRALPHCDWSPRSRRALSRDRGCRHIKGQLPPSMPKWTPSHPLPERGKRQQ